MNEKHLKLFLFFSIILFIYFNYDKLFEHVKNTFFYDRDANQTYLTELEKDQIIKNTDTNLDVNNVINLVGANSKGDHVFAIDDKVYKTSDGKLIINDDEKITYYPVPIKVPINLNDLSLKVKLTFNDYKYIGTLNNSYYRQQYLLYEKPYDHDNELEEKLFYYNLVKIIDDKYVTLFELPPRNKITIGETVWVAYGSLQIGPLVYN